MPRGAVSVTAAHVNYDVEPATGVRGDGFIHGIVKRRIERLEIGSLAAGAQPHPRSSVRGGHRHEAIHAEVHPDAVERLLITATMLDLPERGAPLRIMI